MKLHAIQLRHCSPKDCKEAIVTYVLADNETAIMDYIDKEYCYGGWTDRHNDSLEDPIKIYDDDCEVIGSEFYKEKMLRLRGEFNDEDADYSDAYYGFSHYGWDEGKEVTEEESAILLKLGIAIDLRDSQ